MQPPSAEPNSDALVAAVVAIASLAITTIVQIVLRWLDKRAERKTEVMRLRREALHKALTVIDHVYSNTKGFGDDSHAWDIREARDAWNQMLLYCANPRTATDAFAKALALRNESATTTSVIHAADLVAFRRVVLEELGLSAMIEINPDYVWIKTLAGGK